MSATTSKIKHSEVQIIAALKLIEAGRPAKDVARERGVSSALSRRRRPKYGGLEVNETQRLRLIRLSLLRNSVGSGNSLTLQPYKLILPGRRCIC